MRTKLKAEGSIQKKVLDYIERNASDNLVERINAGAKTLAGCWNFILSEAKKQAVKGCACIEDAAVYGWAMHFFEEDSIKEGETAPAAVVTSSEEVKPAEKTKPSPKKKTDDNQLSLLDMLG